MPRQQFSQLALPADPTSALEAATKQYVDARLMELTPVAVKTASYTANPNEYIPCDTLTTGSFTLTLPSAPENGTLVAFRITSFGAGTSISLITSGTDVLLRPGGPVSQLATLQMGNQGSVYQYYGGVWYQFASMFTMSNLNSYYAQLSVSGGVAPYTICTSSTRPASPVAGMMIFETDTFKTLQYTTATTGWQPPWNQPWGEIAYAQMSGNQPGITNTVTDITNLSISATVVANRKIKTTLNLPLLNQSTAIGTVTATITNTANANVQQVNLLMPAATTNAAIVAIARETPAAGTHARKGRILTTAGSLLVNTSANSPASIFMEDIGPASAPA